MKKLALAIALVTASTAALAQGEPVVSICFNAETGTPVMVADHPGINRSFAVYDLDKVAYGETQPMWKPMIVSPTNNAKVSTFNDGEFSQTVDERNYRPVYMIKRVKDNMSFVFQDCDKAYKPESYSSFFAGKKMSNFQLQVLKRDMAYALSSSEMLREGQIPQYSALKFHESDYLGEDNITPAMRKENQAKSKAFFDARPKEPAADEKASAEEKQAFIEKRINALPFEWASKNHHVISTCDLITAGPVEGKYTAGIKSEKGAIKIIENGQILTATFKHAQDAKPSTMKFAITGMGNTEIPTAEYNIFYWVLNPIQNNDLGYSYIAENCQIEKQ
ncbi:hypothetical protein BIW22_20695 [Salmonella enterica]|nr:hypothetical protein [Salmonella enterica]